jgi:hypothetical protein
VADPCEHNNKPSVSIMYRELLDQQRILVASQGLYSMELVTVCEVYDDVVESKMPG